MSATNGISLTNVSKHVNLNYSRTEMKHLLAQLGAQTRCPLKCPKSHLHETNRFQEPLTFLEMFTYRLLKPKLLRHRAVGDGGSHKQF